ncbi:uncharacterized protein Hap1MRO34_004476 [Clarias gariepinus]
MIRKVLRQILLGGGEEEEDGELVEDQSCVELLECEDEDWIIINTPEDPLENHPLERSSVSVYQNRLQRGNDEDVSDGQEASPRCVQVRRDVSSLLALWCGSMLFSDQRAGVYTERRKLSRSALNRQNLIRTRFSNTPRRYGQSKRPGQRQYNY